ncbi:class I SAM-dependent methyltransferase [Methanobrevibacter filiformis]|uniref:tRNA(Phe) (4-demethylwyosine(37)-C(7)) aminocarboxypropyltransferase n=1 Tax=Methanobrevibacter filiformis TaxID=55758 RepID=A0A166BQU5_9EURY|nr:class I SAM-dependent methyltransferase family protein [Methanobrevibacter filiformis]KZX13696.1 Met-10+ like-protein [Methanobrevibacter filiformis]
MKWKKIGKILVLDKHPSNLDELLTIHNVDTIVKVNNIHGKLREPDIEVLRGNETETIHKENGCLFKLDLSKIMWSKGNTTERFRIAKLVQDGEVIIDMFAGIGYFSIPILVHNNPKKVFSIELNPNSYYFLKENIKLNKIANEKIETILGDSNTVNVPVLADRVLMGYVKTTHHFLSTAIHNLKPGGVLHYHETVPDKLINTRPYERIKKEARLREVEILNIKKIKNYSPGVSHIVVDAKIH